MYSEWSRKRNEEDRGGRRPWLMLHKQASAGRRRGGIEVELSDYHRLPSGADELSPRNLLQGESTPFEAITDLDAFFERLYKYYCGKGFWCIVTQWVIELLSLGFTICFSGFFLLLVDWKVLHKCGVNAVEPCDLLRAALKKHPLDPLTFSKGIVVTYLALFSMYWCFCLLRFLTQLRDTLEIRRFYHRQLHISDRELQTSSWSALLDKIVKFQEHQRLCVVRELSAHDVVMRIMRRDNYLIGMVNKGILAVPLPSWVPGAGPVVSRDRQGNERRLLLTKTLEWSLDWCVLQHMFDRNFLVRKDFINNPRALQRRLRAVGLGMLLLLPFFIIFMFVYFFLRHAEEFYHHPSTATSRRWSNLARWIFREFNEMDHLFSQRLNSSYKHAVEYMKQFPSMILSQVAKFISFVAGGFAATLLIIAFLDETILEAHLFGRNLLWFAAVFGTITAISRSVVIEEFQVFEPERYLRLVACFTHYMPKHWRGAENTDVVRSEFESLFQYTGMTLLEELISIVVTPYTLLFLLPKNVDDVLQFIRDFTMHIDGVGNVCSLSVFDFENHGNQNYGSPFHTQKAMRSCQGKMEKSFLNFQSSYPHWIPDFNGKRFLSILADFQVRSTDELQLTNSYPPHQFVKIQGRGLQNNMLSLLMKPGYGFKWPLSWSNSAQEQAQSAQLREDLLFWGNNLPSDQLYWLIDQYYMSHSYQMETRRATDLEAGIEVESREWPYHTSALSNMTRRVENVAVDRLTDLEAGIEVESMERPYHTSALSRMTHRVGNTMLDGEAFLTGTSSDHEAHGQLSNVGINRNQVGSLSPIYEGSQDRERVGIPDHALHEQPLDAHTHRHLVGSLSAMCGRSQDRERLGIPFQTLDHTSDEQLESGQDSFFLKQGDSSQWWLQQGRPSVLGQGSFLEPPKYGAGAGHFAGSSYVSSQESDEDQEGLWDLTHSRRTYTSSIMEEKASDFELPFGDVFDLHESIKGSSDQLKE